MTGQSKTRLHQEHVPLVTPVYVGENPKMGIVSNKKSLVDRVIHLVGAISDEGREAFQDLLTKPELVRSLQIVCDDIAKARDAEYDNKFQEAIAFYLCASANIPGIIIKFVIQAAEVHKTPFAQVMGHHQEILKRLGDPQLLSHEFLKEHFKEKDDFYKGCVLLMEFRKKLIYRARILEYHMQWNLLSRSFFYHVYPLPQWYNPDWLRPVRMETVPGVHCRNCNKPRKHLAHHYVTRNKGCKYCGEQRIRIGQKYVDEDGRMTRKGKTRSRIIIGGIGIAKVRMKASPGRFGDDISDNIFEFRNIDDMINFHAIQS